MSFGGLFRNAELNSNILLQRSRLPAAGRVRMLIRKINLQPFHHTLAKLVLRQHAQNRFANHFFRFGFKNLSRADFSQAARIKRVPAINLLIQFLAGQFDLVGIDNDDMVASSREKEHTEVYASQSEWLPLSLRHVQVPDRSRRSRTICPWRIIHPPSEIA